jgi:hypothetical protein
MQENNHLENSKPLGMHFSCRTLLTKNCIKLTCFPHYTPDINSLTIGRSCANWINEVPIPLAVSERSNRNFNNHRLLKPERETIFESWGFGIARLAKLNRGCGPCGKWPVHLNSRFKRFFFLCFVQVCISSDNYCLLYNYNYKLIFIAPWNPKGYRVQRRLCILVTESIRK